MCCEVGSGVDMLWDVKACAQRTYSEVISYIPYYIFLGGASGDILNVSRFMFKTWKIACDVKKVSFIQSILYLSWNNEIEENHDKKPSK